MIVGDAPNPRAQPYSTAMQNDLAVFIHKYDNHAAPPADQLFALFLKDTTTAYCDAWRNKKTLRVTA